MLTRFKANGELTSTSIMESNTYALAGLVALLVGAINLVDIKISNKEKELDVGDIIKSSVTAGSACIVASYALTYILSHLSNVPSGPSAYLDSPDF
tara:strand:+ start:6160 stop:6447 length:288 start_codon:yes stop_codon:yes gene_type:complete